MIAVAPTNPSHQEKIPPLHSPDFEREEVAEEQEALRPWARKGGDKKRKTGGVRREKEGLFFSSAIFDGCRRK